MDWPEWKPPEERWGHSLRSFRAIASCVSTSFPVYVSPYVNRVRSSYRALGKDSVAWHEGVPLKQSPLAALLHRSANVSRHHAPGERCSSGLWRPSRFHREVPE